MTRISPCRRALASAASRRRRVVGARPPITQAASGKTFGSRRARRDAPALEPLALERPAVSSKAVELTPVEYFVDPGFREWTIDARKSGRATIRSLGRPDCSTCALHDAPFRGDDRRRRR
jgi:hypothetical protein